jgi:hypothetical protein
MNLANATVTLRVPLTAGIHALTFRQDNAQPRTVWKIETSLRAEGIVPTVSRVTPNSMITSAGATLTLEGRGFEIDTVVELVGSGTTTLRLATTVVSSTQILATLPPNTANGTYTVRLIQPNGSPVATSATVSVGPRRVFLPIVTR